jgi:hypothetical protein
MPETIPVTCLSCQAKTHAPAWAAGRSTKCPRCGEPVVVPYPAADEVEPVSAVRSVAFGMASPSV